MKTLFAIAAALALSGCATFVAPRYTLSADNVMEAKTWNGVKLKVGSFTEAMNLAPPSCNYKGGIATMDGETYAQFIRNALVTDLKFAGVYSESVPISITGKLDKIDNSTAIATDWTIVVTLSSSNGKSKTITEHYNYNGSIVGTVDSTCGAAAAAFVPAVQNLVGKMIREIPGML